MRKPMVAGNWKMNKTVKEASGLVSEMLEGLQALSTVDRVLCPPFSSLMVVSALLEKTTIGLGAQNMYWESSGAYTGEMSPDMVREFCQYVIIGHSERRAYFGETDETVNKRVKAAFAVGLKPIVCVGETLEENESGKTAEVVTRQVKEDLKEVSFNDPASLIIAYEPVWAIGTGKASSGENANAIIGLYIRSVLKDLFGDSTAQAVRILYGGSVNASNAAEFFGQPEIDGALVGGASLKAGDFIGITQAAAH